MLYAEEYVNLKNKINYSDDCILLDDNTELYNFTFQSNNTIYLPGEESYGCAQHDFHSGADCVDSGNSENSFNELDTCDSHVTENKTFRYHIIKPRNVSSAKSVVLFFHGFNEKSWDKYYTWAKKIALDTAKPVVLFPMAFHMNRAPKLWSEVRKMHRLSKLRREMYPEIINSSLSNAAISYRLETNPERFIWSGLQTYYDILQLINEIKSGCIPFIKKDFSADFFGYSIGALLAEILVLTNHEGLFSGSKLCMFCGGAVFNRCSPVSKFILDSAANVKLYSYLVEHLASYMKRSARLGHILSDEHPEGLNFASMLNYPLLRSHRENLFREIRQRTLAISLKKDTIIPSYEIINTIQGSERDINIPVKVFDFDYHYRHEDPFPVNGVNSELVNENFDLVFGEITEFLS